MGKSIQAKNCLFQVNLGDGYETLFCCKSFNISLSTQTKDITTVGNGVYKSYDYDYLSYTVSIDGIMQIPGEPLHPVIFDLIDYQKAFLELRFRAIYQDPDSAIRVIRGVAIVTDSTIQAQPPEVVSGQISLQGTGEYFIDDTLDTCDNESISSFDFTELGTSTSITIEYTGAPLNIEYDLDHSGSFTVVPVTPSPMTIDLPDDLFVGLHYIDIIPLCAETYQGEELSTTFTLSERFSGLYRRANSTGAICASSFVTLYSDVAYAPTALMFTDSGLTTPLTTYTYIVGPDGHVRNLNASTGEVGSDTGVTCTVGVALLVKLGTDDTTLCAATPVTKYVISTYDVGNILYSDIGCTTPVIGFTEVLWTNPPFPFTSLIHNLNSSTGAIGSDTTRDCSASTTSDLTINKLVSGDHISVGVIDTTTSTSATYTFNEAGSTKTFADVLTNGDNYTINITVLPSGRPSCPIYINWATGSNNTPSGTTLNTSGIVPDSTGVVIATSV